MGTGKCLCNIGYTKDKCDLCENNYYLSNDQCNPCNCNKEGITDDTIGSCDASGKCKCKPNFQGKTCEDCADEYYGTNCEKCECDIKGSKTQVCDKVNGKCDCSQGFQGLKCDSCKPGYYGFPNCQACDCSSLGKINDICDKLTGQCYCKSGFDGKTCKKCKDFYYGQNCQPCTCHKPNTLNCDKTDGKCHCRDPYEGSSCLKLNCEWNSWSRWSRCSRNCGFGVETRTRSKRREEKYGGVCIGLAREQRNCNKGSCPGCFFWNDKQWIGDTPSEPVSTECGHSVCIPCERAGFLYLGPGCIKHHNRIKTSASYLECRKMCTDLSWCLSFESTSDNQCQLSEDNRQTAGAYWYSPCYRPYNDFVYYEKTQ